MIFSQTPVDVTEVSDAQQRLLIATERLMLRGGLHTVSLRRIAAEAGAHPALVAYYFGSLPGLLKVLAHANLDVMLNARTQMLATAQVQPDLQQRLAEVLQAYVQPLLYASAYCHDSPASGVIRALINSEDAALREGMVARISQSVKETVGVLAPLLPHIDQTSLLLRLRMLTGAANYLIPRVDELGLFDIDKRPVVDQQASAERAYQELLVFAHGALQAPQGPVT
jgi:AcrR family transcriptional regulator